MAPGSNRPCEPDEDSHPDEDGFEGLRGRAEAGRWAGVGAPPASTVASSVKVVGWSVNATGVAQFGQNRAFSGTSWWQALHAVTGGL